MITVITKTFNSPTIDKSEILRYAGMKDSSPEIDTLIKECLEEIKGKLSYKVCYAHFPLKITETEIDLSFTRVKSSKLSKNLEGCRSFLLFAATVGIEIDRQIARYIKFSPSKALLFQAIGAERIESLCNAFSMFAESEYGFAKPRFSPGYGDLPLEIQKDFFRVLEPGRKIGVSLTESMMMIPSKSVTAIIGISDSFCENTRQNCNNCEKTNCIYRR